jgi:cyclohexanone monooxygenase
VAADATHRCIELEIMPNDTNRKAPYFDVLVVGAGFAGLYSLHRFRGLGLRVRVLEAGQDIGGTWFWNRYPGARCDIESMQYSYSFSDEIQQEWNWTEYYASQPEIHRYINFVADKLDLRRDIQLNMRVTTAAFDERENHWILATNSGECFVSRFVVFATGCLSIPLEPDFPGLEQFAGEVYRTFDWPREGVDLSGKCVGLIGTGSSGIQVAPTLAAQARHLVVFQRTPHYSIPAHNRTLDDGYVRGWKENYRERRRAARLTRNSTLNDAGTRPGIEFTPEEREREFAHRWNVTGGIGYIYGFPDTTTNDVVNKQASDYVRGRIAATVRDPATAAALTPQGYGVGGKRICVDTNYYETFNRANVSLADIKANPIVGITSKGIRTTAGEYELDVLVIAIGFDAMTGALTRVDIRGRDRMTLRDHWKDGPKTYLGLSVAGFPNLFIITGPGSPSVFANMVTSIEQHVDWIADCISEVGRNDRVTVEATQQAEDAWFAHVNEIGGRTILAKAGNSWYVGANVPGKPRVVMPYMGGAATYLEKIEVVARENYSGFIFTSRDPRRDLVQPADERNVVSRIGGHT